MTTLSRTSIAAEASQAKSGHPASPLWFEYGMVILCSAFVFGLFLDGWAHNHGRVDESFFTPWHAVLYGSYTLVGMFLVGNHFRNVMRGYAWSRALPLGYMPGLVGVVLFGMAGGADMVWHTLFGIEENLEALISPSHLALAVGAFLFLTAPIRSAYARQQTSPSWREMLPLIVSLALLLSLLTFFTQYATYTGNAFDLLGRRPRDYWYYDLFGIAGLLITTMLMLGITLFATRRWQLPFGAFGLMFGINAALMVWLIVGYPAQYLLVPAFVLAGLGVDGLLRILKPSADRVTQLRLFAFIVPFGIALIHLLTLMLIGQLTNSGGLWWQIHMWLGVPFTVGIAGYFLSFIMTPPAIAIQETA